MARLQFHTRMFSMGSEVLGGVSNITIEDILVWNSRHAIGIKMATGRGGHVRKIT